MAAVHKDTIIRGLSRIEGQVRGIKNMLAEGRNCEDIIIQINACSSAMMSIAKKMLYDHINNCVVEGIENGDTEKTTENLVKVLEQLFKLK